jgi:hypothetical protein
VGVGWSRDGVSFPFSAFPFSAELWRELVTCNETTYSGLQEHRIIVYTATGQKAKPKVHLSTESTVARNSSKGAVMECAFHVVYDPYGFPYGLDYAASMA